MNEKLLIPLIVILTLCLITVPAAGIEITTPQGFADALNESTPGAAYVRSGNEVVLIKDVTLSKTLDVNHSNSIILTTIEGSICKIRRDVEFTEVMFSIKNSEEFMLTSSLGGSLVLDGMRVLASNSTILVENGSLRMRENVALINNTVSGSGGAISLLRGTLTMEGGNISRNTAAVNGGGILIQNGVLEISGGRIENNTAVSGGGILADDSQIIMSDGVIDSNLAYNGYGGGIYTRFDEFIMSGGSITRNSAYQGGGVFIHEGFDGKTAWFNMSGGTIMQNSATNYGGVALSTYAKMNLSGGNISYNIATNSGGGAGAGTHALIYISNGEISHNTAMNGGGISIDNARAVVITGGNITYNTASYDGGGVCGNVNMSGGLISFNTAKRGGGIYMNLGDPTTLTGGLISENTASENGNGIFHANYYAQDTAPIYFNPGGAIQVPDETYLELGRFITISSATAEFDQGGLWNITPANQTDGVIIARADTASHAYSALPHLRLTEGLGKNLTVSGTNIVIGEPPVVHTFTIETLSPHDIAKGDNITIFGIAEGTDTLRYYVLAPYYSRTGNILVSPDGSYAANFSTSLLLADRPCFVVIQHPMYDEIFNVAPIQNELTGSNIFVYQNNTSAPTGGPGDTFLFNMTNTTGIFAFEKICQGIDNPANDDKELNLTFTIIDPRHDTQIALIPGWNYISVPKILNATESTAGKLFANVTSAVSPIRYDSDSKTWVSVGEGEVILPLNAYWINAEDAVLIQPAYNLVQTPAPVKTVYQGWNAIGLFADANTTANNALDCLNSTWKTLIPWNLADGNYDSVIINGGSGPNSADRFMTLGNGYWLYVDSGGNLTGQSI